MGGILVVVKSIDSRLVKGYYWTCFVMHEVESEKDLKEKLSRYDKILFTYEADQKIIDFLRRFTNTEIVVDPNYRRKDDDMLIITPLSDAREYNFDTLAITWWAEPQIPLQQCG